MAGRGSTSANWPPAVVAAALALVLLTGSGAAGRAQSPVLIDPDSGRYLGNLNANPYDLNSVANPNGRYGSPYSADSINNSYGVYGSPYSPRSVTNPYTTGGPAIVDPSTGRFLGTYNGNRYDPGSVANPYGRYGSPYSGNSINNPYGVYGSPYSPKSATNPYGY